MESKLPTIPTAFEYGKYVNVTGELLRQTLLANSDTSLRWRGDSSDRIHGGARYTYLPYPTNPLDKLLFGGSKSVLTMMNHCMTAANLLMAELLESDDWTVNRLVTNKMPPLGTLKEHPDAEHFTNGVVVIGVGRARLFYRNEWGDAEFIEDPRESLVYVPPGVPHWVENGDEERISVVAIEDSQLLAGQSAVGQKIRGVGRKVLQKLHR